jgi:glycosidase
MGVWKRSRAGMDIFRKEAEYESFRLYLNSVSPGWKEKDLTGSPFSIAAYCPDDMIGTWNDIDNARTELHKRDMKLILDFVPNHTAPDHLWISNNPEYYLTGNQNDYDSDPYMYSPLSVDDKTLFIMRGKDPYFSPWSDTAQLNYFNPGMRSALIQELLTIAQHCDGMRCDMAMLVMNDLFTKHWNWATRNSSCTMPETEFWEEARKAVPDHLLIAEAYWGTDWTLLQLGFDYVYDKRFHDRIKQLDADDIHMHLKAETTFQNNLVRFLENHDESRSAALLQKKQLVPALLTCATVPGMKLFYHGQLEGKKKRTPVQLRYTAPEKTDEEIALLYKKVLGISLQNIFRNGTWKIEETRSLGDDSYLNLLAWTWKLDNSFKLVVVNFGDHVSRASIPLYEEVQNNISYLFHDEFNDRQYMRAGDRLIEKGLMIVLDAYKVHVFDITEQK